LLEYPLVGCLVAPATCGAIADCLHILVASSLPCSHLAIPSPSPRCRLTVASPSPRPPFCPPSSSSCPPSPPHEDSDGDGDGDGDRHRHRRSLSLPVLLPPPMPFFPPSSPLPLSPLSGCVYRAGCSGGTATPAVIRDGPDGRMTKTRYGTASAAALAAAVAAAAMEEEECDGCNGADPQRCLDDSLLRLADGILLRSIVATTATRRGGGGVRTTGLALAWILPNWTCLPRLFFTFHHEKGLELTCWPLITIGV
jgi:hypothetical protein